MTDPVKIAITRPDGYEPEVKAIAMLSELMQFLDMPPNTEARVATWFKNRYGACSAPAAE